MLPGAAEDATSGIGPQGTNLRHEPRRVRPTAPRAVSEAGTSRRIAARPHALRRSLSRLRYPPFSSARVAPASCAVLLCVRRSASSTRDEAHPACGAVGGRGKHCGDHESHAAGSAGERMRGLRALQPSRRPIATCANTSCPPSMPSSGARRPIPSRPSSWGAASRSSTFSASKKSASSAATMSSRPSGSRSSSPSSRAAAPVPGCVLVRRHLNGQHSVYQQQARTSALSGSRPHHQHPGPQATGENAQSREARPVGEHAELVRRIGAPH